MVTITLEVMRAALDSVAERADLNRQDMYLGLRDVIPDEVWKPIWESYTHDLVQERHLDPHCNRDLHGATKTLQSPQKSSAGVQAPVNKSTHAPPQSRLGDAYGSRSQEIPLQDELAHFPELRSRLGGQQQRGPDSPSPERSFERDDDLHSQAQTLRSEAGTIANDAMSHWLGQATATSQALSPFELANWLRMLPKDRLEGDTLKSVARHVLDNNLDEDEFGAAIAADRLASLGVSDKRQAQILERYFKQRQSEAAMAEAAKQEGALNRQFNAKLEAKSWQP